MVAIEKKVLHKGKTGGCRLVSMIRTQLCIAFCNSAWYIYTGLSEGKMLALDWIKILLNHFKVPHPTTTYCPNISNMVDGNSLVFCVNTVVRFCNHKLTVSSSLKVWTFHWSIILKNWSWCIILNLLLNPTVGFSSSHLHMIPFRGGFGED